MPNFKVKDAEAKKRVDAFTHGHVPELSRSSIHKICLMGQLTVNGQAVKPSYCLKVGDLVKLNYNRNAQNEIPKIELPIIFEDKDCLVIDKPAGILTHSKGAFNPEATVATFVKDRIHFPGSGNGNDRAGIVHRLDRGTSGVIIAAKNQAALSWLQKQFSQRKVNKTYRALVKGEINPPAAIIDMPIERNPKQPQTFRTGVNGKPAQTTYRTHSVKNGYSQLELVPKTGRTHQLRVHLKHVGHPIVGDALYGGENAERMFLHASSLELTLPDKSRRIFTSVLPAVFNKFIKIKA